MGALEAALRLQFADTYNQRRVAIDDLRQCAQALLHHARKLEESNPKGAS